MAGLRGWFGKNGFDESVLGPQSYFRQIAFDLFGGHLARRRSYSRARRFSWSRADLLLTLVFDPRHHGVISVFNRHGSAHGAIE